MRAVLDSNVFVSALVSRSGAPAAIISAWLEGAFELVVSEALLAELERVLGYPKVLGRLDAPDAAGFVALLRAQAVVVPGAETGTYRSEDPDDDYLLALAEQEHAILVTGDAHLLELGNRLPIEAPRAFLNRIHP